MRDRALRILMIMAICTVALGGCSAVKAVDKASRDIDRVVLHYPEALFK